MANVGTDGPDTLVDNSNGDATMQGQGGDDSIVGGSGNDRLFGNDGNDTIDATHCGAMVSVDGGAGNDVIYLPPGSTSADILGGEGDDFLKGASFAHGGDGADTIIGAASPLPGERGAVLFGEAGNDSLVGTSLGDAIYPGDGQNTIDAGGAGPPGQAWDGIYIFDNNVPYDGGYANDTVINAPSAGLDFQYAPNGAQITADLDGGVAYVTLTTSSGTQRIADVHFGQIGQILGTSGADSVLGSAGNDVIYGEAGANTIFGAQGNDLIQGGADHNQINGNQGDDTILGYSTVGDWLLGGQGNDWVSSNNSTGHNILNGNLGNDTLIGGYNDSYGAGGGDTLRGGQGDDSIMGGTAGDWISGDLGNNTLTGGHGADTFHAGAGHDLITDFSVGDGDRVEVDHGVTYHVSQVGADVHVDLSNGGSLVLENAQLTSLPADWIISL